MARPSKKNPTGAQVSHSQSPEVIASLERAFSKGATNTIACAVSGVAESTFYAWLKKDKKLQERFEALKNNPKYKALCTIYDDLDTVDTAKWYAERMMKKQFSTRIESTGEDGEPIQITSITRKIIKTNES